jgi:hypothetical protein
MIAPVGRERQSRHLQRAVFVNKCKVAPRRDDVAGPVLTGSHGFESKVAYDFRVADARKGKLMAGISPARVGQVQSGRCAWPRPDPAKTCHRRLFRAGGTRRIRFRRVDMDCPVAVDGSRFCLRLKGFASPRRIVRQGRSRAAWRDPGDARAEADRQSEAVLPSARYSCSAIQKRVGSANCVSNMLREPLPYPALDAANRGRQAVVRSGP